MAKWMVKEKANANGYTSNFIPTEGSKLKLSTSLSPDNMLSRLNLYITSINSIRKIVEKEKKGYEML